MIIISCDRLPVSTSILARCQFHGELFFYIPLVAVVDPRLLLPECLS
ncbi:MAG: hypothetical protein F6K47_08830 [Symploca sp. SIO2E6]|nr:hypothetical protein [Symploca sp. SIO2E6]